MNWKNLLLFCTLACSVERAMAEGVTSLNVGFYAPAVAQGSVVDPERGSIILDGASFYGNVGSSSSPSWVAFSPGSQNISTKTANYSLVGTDDSIMANANSGGFTLTLPAATSLSGKVFTIKKTDNSTNQVTISGNIDGMARKLCTPNETVQIQSDGIGWQSIQHKTVTPWTSYTPSTYAGIGTPSNVEFEWRRVGDSVEIHGKLTFGTVSASTVHIELPSAMTSEGTSKIPSTKLAGFAGRGTQAPGAHTILMDPSMTHFSVGGQDNTGGALFENSGSNMFSNNDGFSFFATIPITDWWE